MKDAKKANNIVDAKKEEKEKEEVKWDLETAKAKLEAIKKAALCINGDDVQDQEEKNEKEIDIMKPEKEENIEEKIQDTITSHVVVGTNVTYEQFKQYSDANPKLHLMWKNKTVYIYEYPIDPRHEAAIIPIRTAISGAPTITSYGTPSMATAAWTREFDEGFASIPFMTAPGAAVDANGTPWPTVVVEVGLDESVADLHADVQLWLGANTSVQMVITIKLWAGRQAMLAMSYTRAVLPNPVNVISFGTVNLHHASMAGINAARGATPITGVGAGGPACNAAGIAAYQLPIPTALLYTGDPGGVPLGLGANINIDLFLVQQRVLLAWH
jgi:hypothetical protein